MLFGYDGNGRMNLAVLASAPAATSYSYTGGTNQLASVTDGAGARTIAYDDRGNTESESRPGSVTLSADYDGYGRLSSYDRSDLGTASFVYNGLDDRVTMSLPTAGTRHFVYDAAGRAMGEYGDTASDVQAEFVWLQPEAGAGGTFGGDDGIGGYAPLAVATPDSSGMIELNWIHGDHLGVPIVATDINGDPASTPDDYLAPGFPGQARMFADLNYNRYRDYDPTTGRYIQADPIGLGGGGNLYVYANDNPVNQVDPDGKNPILLGIALGIGIELGTQALDNWLNGRDVLDPNCYDWGEVATSAIMGGFGGAWLKGGVRLTAGSMKWGNTSRRIRRAEGLINTDFDLHHWLVPRKLFEGLKSPWLKQAGDWLFNRPWNLNVVPRGLHQTVLNHGNPIRALLQGAPKPALGAIGAGITRAGEELYDTRTGGN